MSKQGLRLHKNANSLYAGRASSHSLSAQTFAIKVARWVFREAFPQKYEGPRLNARSSEVAIETLVICCESLEREE